MISHILSNPTILAHCQAGEWEQAATALGALTETRRNNILQTCWGYGDRYGDTAMRSVLSFLKAVATNDVAIEAAYNAWQTRGLDLSNDKMQTQLAALKTAAESNPATEAVGPLIAALAQMGRWNVPVFSPSPNAASVQAAWAAHVQDHRIARWSQVNAHVVNEILSSGGTWAEALAYVAGQEE
jgi:hypothetical protein